MGKKPRPLHIIKKGDGTMNHKIVPNDELVVLQDTTDNRKGSRGAGVGVGGGGNSNFDQHSYLRSRKRINERIIRAQQPLVVELFRNGSSSTIGKQTAAITPVSAFALLAMLVVISGIFLHMVFDNSYNKNDAPNGRTRHVSRPPKKKKTDEWNDDQELDFTSPPPTSAAGGVAVTGVAGPSAGEDVYPVYHYRPAKPADRFFTKPKMPSKVCVREPFIPKQPDVIKSKDASWNIDFKELKLHEVIGVGGFGQVRRATWRGTPVAVKVLRGSAQQKRIVGSILEEFQAEINLLEGLRHPNICLYMGACIEPPNRAIVTEFYANGSVWDALRLPLMAPYISSDGTQRGAWPVQLYLPDDKQGVPSTAFGIPNSGMLAPIPPKGTWPWKLVQRVAIGAARGMAYLHSGNPPVLHRDLKSANLLLDDSYTTKVCDFGLSRLKAQAQITTGYCGTIQWMAPEVLQDIKYDEKADVFSFGIILWELLSRECPYEGMGAIECGLAVLNDKRPEIPKWCPPAFHALITSCVKKEPDQRPSFPQVILTLDAMDV